MLILGRFSGQSIIIDGGIIVTVFIDPGLGRRVRLCIKAPPSIKIMRDDMNVVDASDSSALPNNN